VHILRDKNGNTPSNYPFFLRGTDAQVAWNVRQQFDQTAVRYPVSTIGFTSTEVSMSATRVVTDPFAKRTATIRNIEMPVLGDDIFGQCGVQLRLASVTFLRQSLGLEQALLSNAEQPVGDCHNEGYCSNSRIGPISTSLRDAYDAQPSLGKGIHVFIGGMIFPDSVFCGGLHKGTSCSSTGGRIVFVDATGARSGMSMNTVFHEIGHVLLHTGNHKLNDENNLMYPTSDVTEGALLDPGQCDTIRTTAFGF
jgi:hypothetical protein